MKMLPAPSFVQGGNMNRSVTVGDIKLSIPGRIMRVVRMILQFPGHVLNLVAFRAQQIMLGSAFTKLVRHSLS